MSRDYLPFLKTLRRIPEPIVLAMGSRLFEMTHPQSCICGWAVREALAFANGHTADELSVYQNNRGVTRECAVQFGGGIMEWEGIFWGVTGKDHQAIEEAFVRRVEECAR